MKETTIDLWWTLPHAAETSWNMVIFESTNKTSKTNASLNCRQIWLDCEQQPKNAKPGLLWWKFNMEPNTRIVKHFLIFPTVICTNWYDKQFKSYEILNISQAVVSLCWLTGTTWETAFLTTEALSSQKTCNTKLVGNFLKFPFITRMLKSVKQRRSYSCWNTVHKWKNLEYRFWFGLTTISQNSADWIRCRIRRNVQCKSDREFWDLSIKHKYALIRPTVQQLRSLQFGGAAELSFGQTAAYRAIWTLDQRKMKLKILQKPNL
jgi:hypothetical protein